MANTAEGTRFCIATPHYKSSMLGMKDFLEYQNTASATLTAALSLSYNLPHLCGLGGDAIFMQKDSKGIYASNGTGKTGSGQSYDAYREKGFLAAPRRGAFSTMVYGCPHVYQELVDREQIDLKTVTNNLLNKDLAYGLVETVTLRKAFKHALGEMSITSGFDHWRTYFDAGIDPGNRYADTLRTLARENFKSLYSGSLGDRAYNSLSAVDPNLFSPEDFSHFTPNATQICELRFLDARVTVHGNNSPWRQLFLLLKIYELYVIRGVSPEPSKICFAAAWIEDISKKLSLTAIFSISEIEKCACELFDRLQSPISLNLPLDCSLSHTIFMACANADGYVIGLSNSIFTPLGALFEIDDSGILLSNRCFSFNYDSPEKFLPRVSARHTNNCVIVETNRVEFIVGTSGGPVQSQTLAYLLYLIVAHQMPVSIAIRQPRFANLGLNRHTGLSTYLCEQVEAPPGFSSTMGFSEKFGVVQIAGRDIHTGRVFAAADPRGDGVALAI